MSYVPDHDFLLTRHYKFLLFLGPNGLHDRREVTSVLVHADVGEGIGVRPT